MNWSHRLLVLLLSVTVVPLLILWCEEPESPKAKGLRRVLVVGVVLLLLLGGGIWGPEQVQGGGRLGLVIGGAVFLWEVGKLMRFRHDA
jgi:hypothetical protein